jgi:hypothetical protein
MSLKAISCACSDRPLVCEWNLRQIGNSIRPRSRRAEPMRRDQVREGSRTAHNRPYVQAGVLSPAKWPRSVRVVSAIGGQVTAQSIPTASARQALSRTPALSRESFRYGRSGDVGDRVIGQSQTGMPRPTRGGTGRRTSLGGERRPLPQVLEDAPDDSRILD